jgi:hypothetical protein
MKTLKTLLAGAVIVTAAALPLQSANAWWGGPWGPAGPWGYPGMAVPPAVSKIPGWSPQEIAEKYDFYGPYGPSITDIRRLHRDLAWGRPMDDLYSPLGPSPTDIRRQERRAFHRSMGLPY